MTDDKADYAATRKQVQVGQYNDDAEIIAAVPDLRAGLPHYVVTAAKYGRAGDPPREFITWCVRTDQPGYYWGRYFLVNDGGDPQLALAEALTDMTRRAGIDT